MNWENAMDENSMKVARRPELEVTMRNQSAQASTHSAAPNRNANDRQYRVDSDVFRSVMRQLVGGVTVITTADEGRPHGFTATAVCSVCSEPPTVLIVVNRTSRTHPHIDARRRFAVNMLATDQRHIADMFAGKRDDQFDGMAYTTPENGAPVFEGVAAFLQCVVNSRLDVGTHTIFIGEVVEGGTSDSGPLIYHAAKYGRVNLLD